MARTVTAIYDSLVSEKENLDVLSGLTATTPDDSQTFLQSLSSTSKVAIWRLFLWVVAVGSWTVETLFDRHVAEITALKNKLFVATPLWWQARALEFQLGDSLEWNGSQFVYTTLDESAQIVKRSAVVATPGIVRIKVAKLDGDGLPTLLSGPEITAFTAYAHQLAPAGINVIIISAEADLFKCTWDVYYNPLVLNSDGELLTDPSVKPVEAAIEGYLQNLPFNGRLTLTELVDAVQLAEGVVNPVLLTAAAKYGATSYIDVAVSYLSYAGYLKIDPAQPLSSSINYIPA